MFYENIYKICKEKKTTPTTVLKALGYSSGNVSKWKSGSIPNIDMAYHIANYLDVSLDYLITGSEKKDTCNPIAIDPEWVEIISHIPVDKQDMCKDFLRTHMVIPEKYADRKRA